MIIKTITTLPPLILQKFSSTLLSMPMAKFSDDKETLMEMYKAIKRRLLKPHSDRKRRKEIPELEQEFLRLYEQIEKKEEEVGREKLDKRLFYFIDVPDRRLQAVFIRFKLYT